MKKIFIVGGIFLVLAIGIAFWGRGAGGVAPESESVKQSASALTALTDKFEFGTIAMKDGNVSKIFDVENEGTEPITINKVYTSCMCTTAKITDARGNTNGPFGMLGHGGASKAEVVIGAGETAQVEVIFNPAAHGPSGVGLASRTVYLETNSIQTPKVELNFKANVTN